MNAESIPPSVPQPRKNKLAVTSLFLGILAICTCVAGALFAIPGLICGILGMKRVKASGGIESGHGLALAGTIMSAVSLLLTPVLALLLSIAIPNFVKARNASARAACRANLMIIDGAKSTWALENKKLESDVPKDADLFGGTRYVREKPACPMGGTYTVRSVGEKPTCSVSGHTI